MRGAIAKPLTLVRQKPMKRVTEIMSVVTSAGHQYLTPERRAEIAVEDN